MFNRIAAAAVAALLAAGSTGAIAQEGAAATDGPLTRFGLNGPDGSTAFGSKTVGAMHFATTGLATDQASVLRQSRGLVTAVPAYYAPAPQTASSF